MAITKIPGSLIGANTITGNNIAAGTITTADIAANVTLGTPGPTISSITYPGDDTAANTAGGQTIVITGNNFLTGAYVVFDNAIVSPVTVTNSTSISFTSPAKAAGSYVLFVTNTDGSAAILYPGIQYSGTPAWSTSAGSISTGYEYDPISTTLSASSDSSITYSVASGTLPSGVTLAANGQLSGTAPAQSGSTTFTFTVRATDGENQSTDRTFTVTINPDAVTWSAPANNSTITTYEYNDISNTFAATSAAGRSIVYTANTLPANVSISGNVVSGTPTTVGNTTSLITATANTTGKTKTQTLNFVVQQDAVTWSSPANDTIVTTPVDIANSVGLSATSAAGFNVTYSANVLPTGMSISGNTIVGTPTVVGNTTTLLTATANTTNRTATRVLNWVIQVGIDLYWKNTNFLLSSNTSTQPASFLADESLNAYQLTAYGDVRSHNNNPYQHGYYSVYFDGTGDYLSGSSATMNFGSNDLSIEFWMYPFNLTTASQHILTSGNGNLSILLVDGNGTIQPGNYGYTGIINSTGKVLPNQWSHVVVTRSGTAWRVFINGLLQGYSTYDFSPNNTGFSIGGNGTNAFMGHLSNFRVVNGYVPAGYTTSSTTVGTSVFTPPTAPLQSISNTALLVCQSHRLIDTSSANVAITKNGDATVSVAQPFTYQTTWGSGYFDGTGDYITIPSSPISTTDSFTAEAWVYPTTTTDSTLFYIHGNNGSFAGLRVGCINGNTYVLHSTSGSSWAVNSGNLGSVPINAWSHIAVTRNVNAGTLWVNGVSVYTFTFGTLMTGTYHYIGAILNSSLSVSFNGYIASARVVGGTALYTTGFTSLANTPFTAVSNTQLLTLQSRGSHNNYAFNDNSEINRTMLRANNATSSAFSPYGTNWGVYFDGSSYIATPNTVSTAMGGGFAGNIISIEMFVYPNNFFNGSYGNAFIGAYQAVSANGRWIFYHNRSADSTTTLGFSYTTGTGSQNSLDTTNAVLYQNQWNHIAITIDATTASSATIKIYANGNLVQTWTGQDMSTHTTYYDNPRIGGPSSSYVSNFAGYISNVRILKGALAYNSSTYTVPTSSFVDTSNTVLNACRSNRFIDTSASDHVLTTSSNTVVVQKFSPFNDMNMTAQYSVAFNGTTDYIKAPASSTYQAFDWSGSWTIEGWYRFRSVSGSNGLFTYPDLLQGYYDGTTLRFAYRSNATWYDNNTAYALLPNTWYHIALVQNNGSLRCYVNGTGIGTATTGIGAGARGSTTGFGEYLGIGCNDAYPFGSPDHYLNGLISNFRVSKVAVYTGNFTPPTSQLQTTQNAGTNIAALTAGQVTLLTCQNNTIIDNTLNCWAMVAATGTAKPVMLGPFATTVSSPTGYNASTSGGSIYLDGTGDMVYRQVASPSPYVIPGDFTAELWVYPTGTEASYLFMYSSQKTAYTADIGFMIKRNMGSIVIASTGGGGTTYNVNFPANTVITPGKWQHVALVRSANTIYAYLDGVRSTTGTAAAGTIAPYTNRGDLAGPGGFYIGTTDANWTGFTPIYFAGYLSDVKLTIGAALYTSSFYPNTTPPPTTVSIGSNQYKAALHVTGAPGGAMDATRSTPLETLNGAALANFGPYNQNYYSNYFDGSGDYLSVPTTSGSLDATGDFTTEMWIYWNSMPTTGYQNICGQGAGGQSSYGLMAGATASDTWSAPYKFKLNVANSGDVLNGDTTLVANRWYHLAHTRTSGVNRLFVNGVVQSSTYTDNTSRGFGGNPFIIANNSNCYISNFRYVKGTSLYTTTFTPPTSPLTAISGTGLLTCQSNRFIDNTANNITITPAGDVAIKSINPFRNNSGQSYYFAGTSYMAGRSDDPNFGFGKDNFTIEGWVYPTATDAYLIVDTRRQNEGKVNLGLTNAAAGMLVSYGSTAIVTANTGAGMNRWTHFAAVRTANTMTLYLNGLVAANGSMTDDLGTTGSFCLGTAGDARGNNSYDFHGYLSDVRITRGYARYTTAFTPPTEPYKVK